MVVMTTTIPHGLSETRAMALAMFEHQVPCFFQLADPACSQVAKWLAFFEHEEQADGCDGMDPWPLCDEHRRAVAMASSPFWRMWMNLPSSPCAKCETPVRVARMEGL